MTLFIDGHRLQAFCLELGVMNRDLPRLLRETDAPDEVVAFLGRLEMSRQPAPLGAGMSLARALEVSYASLKRAGVIFEPAPI